MQYMIVNDLAPEGLTKKVNDAIKDGWEPLGGVSVILAIEAKDKRPGQLLLHQAMTKKTT